MSIYFKEIDGRPAFFDEAVHGARQIEQPQTKREIKAGKRPAMIDNPDCLIPADATEISRDRHRALLDAQSGGKQIVVRGGQPVAVDPEADPAERALRRRIRRDRALESSDWTQLGDALLDRIELKAEWAAYRQALRDLDMAGTDWPAEPGAAA